MSSTPLAPPLGALDAETRADLTREVCERWEPFVANGSMVLELDVVAAGARG